MLDRLLDKKNFKSLQVFLQNSEFFTDLKGSRFFFLWGITRKKFSPQKIDYEFPIETLSLHKFHELNQIIMYRRNSSEFK